jgi:hypothetical protein
MPFKSEAQRRYLFAKEPEVAKEFAKATPKGKKLPEHVKKSHVRGIADALERFGFKQAAEELRLKIPTRTFHGLDAAHKPNADRSTKKADEANTADTLAQMLEQIDASASPDAQLAAKDPLDRSTSWGSPSNLAAGDTAGRLSDMGQNTAFGGV